MEFDALTSWRLHVDKTRLVSNVYLWLDNLGNICTELSILRGSGAAASKEHYLIYTEDAMDIHAVVRPGSIFAAGSAMRAVLSCAS